MSGLIETLILLALAHRYSPAYPLPLPELIPSPETLSESAASPVGPPVPFYPEHLEFTVKWGLIKAGNATLSVTEVVKYPNPSPFGPSSPPRAAYRIVSTARSKGLADSVYRVRDRNQSWLDTRTLSSLAFYKQLREGSFFRDEWTRFFPDQNRFVLERKNKDGKVSRRQGVVPPGIHDVLSALYYVRMQPLEVGKTVTVDVNSGTNWPLAVKVTKREKIEVPAGKFDCFRLEPELRAEGIFIQKGKDMKLWVTADERRMPVLMEVEVFIGHISAKLEKFRRDPPPIPADPEAPLPN